MNARTLKIIAEPDYSHVPFHWIERLLEERRVLLVALSRLVKAAQTDGALIDRQIDAGTAAIAFAEESPPL